MIWIAGSRASRFRPARGKVRTGVAVVAPQSGAGDGRGIGRGGFGGGCRALIIRGLSRAGSIRGGTPGERDRGCAPPRMPSLTVMLSNIPAQSAFFGRSTLKRWTRRGACLEWE